jgi:alpha-D-ribose 1-methylphosphonate 5-triphosphate synthase subunit PhnG
VSKAAIPKTPLDRAERLAGLAAAARTARPVLIDLADQALAAADAVIVEYPEPYAAPLTLRTAVGESDMGAAVVTRCAVTIDGRTGWGLVLGWDRHACLAAAVLDGWGGEMADALAREALAAEQQARQREASLVLLTRTEPA